MSDHQSGELSTVMTANNAGLIAIAKSILNEAGIEYFTKGEDLPYLCRINIQVAKEDAETAKELLKELL